MLRIGVSHQSRGFPPNTQRLAPNSRAEALAPSAHQRCKFVINREVGGIVTEEQQLRAKTARDGVRVLEHGVKEREVA
eukprot:3239166-Pleurochrysis_carterae.AAC.1